MITTNDRRRRNARCILHGFLLHSEVSGIRFLSLLGSLSIFAYEYELRIFAIQIAVE